MALNSQKVVTGIFADQRQYFSTILTKKFMPTLSQYFHIMNLYPSNGKFIKIRC